jgi:uncharacterized membrane protein YdjX (TVP38/TMEM64 family)
MAERLYKIMLLSIVSTLFVGGVIDFCLDRLGEPTITDWLRKHPAWFYVPAFLMMSLLIALEIHLYGK